MQITLTGADERTSIADLHRLVCMGAEIGLLYTFSPDGRNRYMALGELFSLADVFHGKCALHICGRQARDRLAIGDLDYLIERVGRIQINGHFLPGELESFCRLYPTHTIITQHGPAIAYLVEVPVTNHAILVDASGGRGISPQQWERPETDKLVGFAGGLGPDNLAVELPKIAALSPESWVDMEGKLRDPDDWFSAERALEVMRIFTAFSRGQP
jgi:hypothetical protein